MRSVSDPTDLLLCAQVARRGRQEASNPAARGELSGSIFGLEQRLRGDLTAAQLRLRFILEKCLTNTAPCYMLPPSEAQSVGAKDSCTSQRLWGGNPTIHIE
jgi:hypothetical protein